MRIRTDGKMAYREDLYNQAADVLDEPTRVGGLDSACAWTVQMLPALEEAAEHPDMTEELAEVLSTSVVEVEYRVESDVNVRD